MKAILRTIGGYDIDLKTFTPQEKDNFNLLVSLSIGPENEEGINWFDLHVCTTEWLCQHQWVPELMRHTLLVRKFDFSEIKKVITDYIDKCEGDNWEEIAQKLSRVFAWEFENYQPYTGE